MKLSNYIDELKLESYIGSGYINRRRHPTLPISILNYGPAAQFENVWPHEVCACRGLIVDDENNIVSRPQYKFFNLGQHGIVLGTQRDPKEITEGVIDDLVLTNNARVYHSDLTITRKMDGQMGVLWNHGDQWGIATRGSFESEGAKFATEKWQKFVKYGATEFVPKGWTLIFEIIAKHLRIVIPYEWEGLCLLTAVNNETGEEMSYDQLHELWVRLNSYSKTVDADGNSVAGKPWCRIVEKFDISLADAEGDQSKEEEGYVVAVNRPGLSPVKVKVKLEEYKRLHKVLTGLTPQMIWHDIALPIDKWLTIDSKYDRATGTTSHSLPVPPEFAAWVKQWQRGMTNSFHSFLSDAIKAKTELAERDGWQSDPFKNDAERKKWLMSPNGGLYQREVVEAAMLLYRDRIVEAYDTLWKLVRPHGRDDKFFVEGKGE